MNWFNGCYICLHKVMYPQENNTIYRQRKKIPFLISFLFFFSFGENKTAFCFCTSHPVLVSGDFLTEDTRGSCFIIGNISPLVLFIKGQGPSTVCSHHCLTVLFITPQTLSVGNRYVTDTNTQTHTNSGSTTTQHQPDFDHLLPYLDWIELASVFLLCVNHLDHLLIYQVSISWRVLKSISHNGEIHSVSVRTQTGRHRGAVKYMVLLGFEPKTFCV